MPPSKFKPLLESKTPKRLEPEEFGACFLYVIDVQSQGLCWSKIGISNDLRGRYSSIQNGCPIDIKRFCYAEVASRFIATTLEKYFHAHLHDSRTSGEWFSIECNSKLLETLTSHAQPMGVDLTWKEFTPPQTRVKKQATVATNIETARRWLLKEADDRQAAQELEKERLAEISRRTLPKISYKYSAKFSGLRRKCNI